ncbi:MAG: hypothetical protein GXY07_07470 [Candidatus Hydrogenedentes bacterium]|nr:hypothetical protein [Candidatus Hydrogenedentota bacterium]
MLIHITQKLQQKLHVPTVTAFPMAGQPHQRWYANLFRANRQQYMLTTNAATLYTVVFYGRGVKDDVTYGQAFKEALEQQLLSDNMGGVYQGLIAPCIENLVFVKTADRSVLGSMNDMVRMLILHLEQRDSPAHLVRLGTFLNETPFKTLHWKYPREAFVEFLQKEQQ